MFARRACLAGAAMLVAATVLVLVPGVAQAGVAASSTVEFPATVTVGQTGLAASIVVENKNTPPDNGTPNIVCNFGDGPPCPAGDPGITLTPSCGQQALFSCPPASADAGVFTLSPTATGSPGGGCPNALFSVALIDPVLGTYRFTPQPANSHVALASSGISCRINFAISVAKAPTIDANPGLPGVQTAQLAFHTQHNLASGTATTSVGSGTVTVQAPALAIATTASPDVQVLVGQMTDTAVVSGRVAPAGGATITFRLYGPNDATCTTAPVFQSVVSYPVAGGPVTSAPFTPTQAGTYRWVAAYSGDANNAPVTGVCSDPAESVEATVGPPGGQLVTRLSGPDRIETAIAASQDRFGADAAGAVVVARADAFPDALAGAPLAADRSGPLLLTGSAGLDARTATEIDRALPAGGAVHVLGGSAALSPAVSDALVASGYNVVLYDGADRYETAAIIATAGLDTPGTVLLATGTGFADALAGGAAAANVGAAVLLTNGSVMPAATASYLALNPPTARFALGGPAAAADPTATPLVGTDRYHTSRLVAEEFFVDVALRTAGFASGVNFPDGLAGGAHVARSANPGPLLLVQPDAVPATVGEYLTARRAAIESGFLYGGPIAVDEPTRQALEAAIS
ncbi:MAG: cell wall-binding repeat-containing protein [Acidimicrobiia bacterium]